METAPPHATWSPPDPEARLDPRARAQILFAILLALFLSALDQTIVGTAMPRILTDLQGFELYTWVVTIYLLTATITGPIYGKLSDQFGRRLLLMIGVGLFLLGSFLSGLAGEMWQLILFRGIQGLGAGAIFPIALAVIGDIFSPQERGKYQGLFGAVFGLSAIIGPALGGFLTDQIGWQWVFFVNLPIGAVALAIIWRLLPSLKREGVTRKVDYAGVFVFSLALVPILVALTRVQSAGWSDPTVLTLLLGGLALVPVFLWVEARAAEPIVPLDLWRNRTYTTSIVATFLSSFGFFAAILFLPLWFQIVNGSSATESGYQVLPLLGGLIASSIVSGALVSRTGRYKWLMVGSLAVLATGLYLMTNLRADTPEPALWLWMFVTGVGIGPSFAVFTIVVQNGVPWQQLGVATSNLTFFRQVGGTVGLALAGTIFGSTLRQQLPTKVSAELAAAGVPQDVVDRFAGQMGSGDFDVDQVTGIGDVGANFLQQIPEQFRPLLEPLLPAVVRGFNDAFSIAIADTMWLGAAVTLIAVAVTFALPELTLRRTVAPTTATGRAISVPAEAPAATEPARAP